MPLCAEFWRSLMSHRIDLFCEDRRQAKRAHGGNRRWLAKSPATRKPLQRFHSDSGFEARRGVQSPDTDQLLLRDKSAVATPREIAFGSFRLLPAQLLLLQGDRPV